MTATVEISTLAGDGTFLAYIARPVETPRAAVILIQEIFGVNTGIRQKCDRLAAEGYIAIAPDLFWRLEPGIELDPDIESELHQGFDLFGKFDQDKGIADIEATIKYVRESEGCDRVGAVGYCLGGRLAYMTAARTDIDASVGYYPVGIPELLREKHAIAHPLLLHVAGEDQFVSQEMQKEMHDGLDDHQKVTLYDYPGLNHGFATEMGRRRDEDAARLADSRTSEFFAQHLG